MQEEQDSLYQNRTTKVHYSHLIPTTDFYIYK